MGLSADPYVDEKQAEKNVNTAADIALARQVAQESITLLENRNNTLPLSKNVHVALVGPNADNVYNMLGDYTAQHPQATSSSAQAPIWPTDSVANKKPKATPSRAVRSATTTSKKPSTSQAPTVSTAACKPTSATNSPHQSA